MYWTKFNLENISKILGKFDSVVWVAIAAFLIGIMIMRARFIKAIIATVVALMLITIFTVFHTQLIDWFVSKRIGIGDLADASSIENTRFWISLITAVIGGALVGYLSLLIVGWAETSSNKDIAPMVLVGLIFLAINLLGCAVEVSDNAKELMQAAPYEGILYKFFSSFGAEEIFHKIFCYIMAMCYEIKIRWIEFTAIGIASATFFGTAYGAYEAVKFRSKEENL